MKSKSIYRNSILQWFEEKVSSQNRENLFSALLDGDDETLGSILNHWLLETISYYDGKESYYHGFLCGLLTGLNGYYVKSNRESGDGRPDILVLAKQKRRLAIIIEIKVAKDYAALEEACQLALKQIQEKGYIKEVENLGYQKIICYGISFYEKDCFVKKA